jgi:uncharacterized membrane protein YuzA (DUF378 family)
MDELLIIMGAITSVLVGIEKFRLIGSKEVEIEEP